MLRCVVLVEEPESSPREIDARPGMIFGRASQNDCVVADPTVGSRQFRVVELDADDWFVEDLGSTNPTRIHGGRELGRGERHPLREGLRFYAGKTSFTVKTLASVPATTGEPTVAAGGSAATERYEPESPADDADTFSAPTDSSAEPGLPAAHPTNATPTEGGDGLGLPALPAALPAEPDRTIAGGGLPGAGLPSAPTDSAGEPGLPHVPSRQSPPSSSPTPPLQVPLGGDRTLVGGALPGAHSRVPTDDAREHGLPATGGGPGLPMVGATPTDPSAEEGLPDLGFSPGSGDRSEGDRTLVGGGLPGAAGFSPGLPGGVSTPPREPRADPDPAAPPRPPAPVAELDPAGMAELARLSPRLLVAGSGINRTVRVTAAELSIGRDPSCAVPIKHPHVSDLHARIIFDGRLFAIEDLGSKNGTYLDGSRLRPHEPQVLGPESRVTFGSVDALFVIDEDGVSGPSHERAARFLLEEGTIDKARYKQAMKESREERRHAGELLIEARAIEVAQWVDAFRHVRREGEGGSSVRKRPKAGGAGSGARKASGAKSLRGRLPENWVLWAAIAVLGIAVVVLIGVLLSSGGEGGSP